MGSASPVIVAFAALDRPKLVIEASDGKRYFADLSDLSSVHCFPRDDTEWNQASIDSHGLALVWKSRFEVHVDQIIGLATRSEAISSSAAG